MSSVTSVPAWALDVHWTMYVRLWGRAEGAGVYVKYQGKTSSGEGGYFEPHDDEPGGEPQIAITRSHYVDRWTPSPVRNDGVPVDVLAELCTLAHEVGHFRSWKAGFRTEPYKLALQRMNERRMVVPPPSPLLAAGDRVLVEEEEARAWKLGRQELVGLGFKEWAAYEQAEKTSREAYAAVLGT